MVEKGQGKRQALARFRSRVSTEVHKDRDPGGPCQRTGSLPNPAASTIHILVEARAAAGAREKRTLHKNSGIQ